MLVLGVNRILNWCQIISGGRKYTCPIKEVDGQLLFRFKKIWYPVGDYIFDQAEEVIEEGGKIISRPFQK